MSRYIDKIIKNKEYLYIILLSVLAGIYSLTDFFIDDITLLHDPYYRFARAIQYDNTGSFYIIAMDQAI